MDCTSTTNEDKGPRWQKKITKKEMEISKKCHQEIMQGKSDFIAQGTISVVVHKTNKLRMGV